MDALKKVSILTGSLFAVAGFILTTIELIEWMEYRRLSFEDKHIRFSSAPPENDEFIKFLIRNNGNIVNIRTQMDFSRSIDIDYSILESCDLLHVEQDGIFNADLQFPHNHTWNNPGYITEFNGCDKSFILNISTSRESPYFSSGGTGLVFYALRGEFEVYIQVSGSQTRATLKEVF